MLASLHLEPDVHCDALMVDDRDDDNGNDGGGDHDVVDDDGAVDGGL